MHPGGLNNRHLSSQESGGWTISIKVMVGSAEGGVDPVPPQLLVDVFAPVLLVDAPPDFCPCLHTPFSSVGVCVPSNLYKDICHWI